MLKGPLWYMHVCEVKRYVSLWGTYTWKDFMQSSDEGMGTFKWTVNELGCSTQNSLGPLVLPLSSFPEGDSLA